MSNVFKLYDSIEPKISKAENELKALIQHEFIDIAHIKTTSMNQNYMFNDNISSKFYNALGMTKEGLKQLIRENVTSTSNYDSLDPNNMMLLFLMRYFMKKNDIKTTKECYDIFLYKLYYPIFTQYFKYGVDESVFNYFVGTLSGKYDITRRNNIYEALDNKGLGNWEAYSINLVKNDEKLFLLIPVNTKARINQFVKELMKAYVPFIQSNKIHMNAYREFEVEDGSIIKDQMRNNHSVLNEYANRLKLAFVHDELNEKVIYSYLKVSKRLSEHDLITVYKGLMKDHNLQDEAVKIFISEVSGNHELDSQEFLKELFSNCSKYKDTHFTEALDKILNKLHPEFKGFEQKALLIELRKFIVFVLYMFLLKSYLRK